MPNPPNKPSTRGDLPHPHQLHPQTLHHHSPFVPNPHPRPNQTPSQFPTLPNPHTPHKTVSNPQSRNLTPATATPSKQHDYPLSFFSNELDADDIPSNPITTYAVPPQHKHAVQTSFTPSHSTIPTASSLTPFTHPSGQSTPQIQPPTTTPSHWSTASWTERFNYTAYYIPILTWFPKYSFTQSFPEDLFAGLSVGAVLTPQSLAYASILSLPPIYGLVTAFISGFVYLFFGHSPILSIGPQAATSILLANSIATLPLVTLAKQKLQEGLITPDQYTLVVLSATTALTFLAGVVTLIFGLLRLGFIDSIFSRPILSGLICGVGLQLLTDQTPKVIGLIPCKDCHNAFAKLANIFDQIFIQRTFNMATVCIGFSCVFFLFIWKYLKHRYPQHINTFNRIPHIFLLVLTSTLLSYIFDFHSMGVATLGAQSGPGFVFSPQFPNIFVNDQFSLYLSRAIILAILTFIETQLVNKTVLAIPPSQLQNQPQTEPQTEPQTASRSTSASTSTSTSTSPSTTNHTDNTNTNPKTKHLANFPHPISPNRELIALGMVHCVTALFGGYISCGSLARTKVSAGCQSKSQVTNFVSISIVLLSILFFMPFFAFLPNAVAGGIIFFVAIGLLETDMLRFTFQTKQWTDFCLNFLMIIITYLGGVENGLMFAFAICLLLVVKQQNKPQIRLFGKFSQTNVLSGVRTVDGLEERRRIEEGLERERVNNLGNQSNSQQPPNLSTFAKISHFSRSLLPGFSRPNSTDVMDLTLNKSSALSSETEVIFNKRQPRQQQSLQQLPEVTTDHPIERLDGVDLTTSNPNLDRIIGILTSPTTSVVDQREHAQCISGLTLQEFSPNGLQQQQQQQQQSRQLSLRPTQHAQPPPHTTTPIKFPVSTYQNDSMLDLHINLFDSDNNNDITNTPTHLPSTQRAPSTQLPLPTSLPPTLTTKAQKPTTIVEFDPNTQLSGLQLNGMMIYQFDGPIFFCNAGNIKDRLRRIESYGCLNIHPSNPTLFTPIDATLRCVIFDFQSVTLIDSTGLSVIIELIQEYQQKKITVLFVKVRRGLLSMFIDSGIIQMVGMKGFKRSVESAIEYAEQLRFTVVNSRG